MRIPSWLLRARGGVALLLGLVLAPACERPTALVFRIAAPQSAALDPFSLPVSDYVLKDAAGGIVAAVSAGASRDDSGRLELGALPPNLASELRLDVMSGAQLIGVARVHEVLIDSGATRELVAEVRKPLVTVGTAAAPEGAGVRRPTQLLDPTTSLDLAEGGIDLPAADAASFTSDGRALLVAGTAGLSVFDTGAGTTTPSAPLPFVPRLLVLSPGDRALALVERGAAQSQILLYTDVPTLLARPSTPPSMTTTIRGGLPRAAHFSPDGSFLYVLVEDAAAEPCTGPKPPANAIVPVDVARGTASDMIMLPSYAADFAVDRRGRLVLAEPGADQISILTLTTPDGAGGVGAPVQLYQASCPTALRLLEEQIFAVTNDPSKDVPDAFTLLRGRLDGSSPTRLPISRPAYETQLNRTSTRDKLTHINLQFVSTAVASTDMAVSPDGNRALVATRVRYRETPAEEFDFVGLTCVPDVDIVEHGVFSIDLIAGTALYERRSQNTIVPADPANDPCVSCVEFILGVALDLTCPSRRGDRAAGLSAAFSGAP